MLVESSKVITVRCKEVTRRVYGRGSYDSGHECNRNWGDWLIGAGLVGVVRREIMALYNVLQEVPRLQSRRGECIRFTERPRDRRNKEQ